MSDGLTEEEVVRGLRRGDRNAWDALYQQYSRRVWRHVARLVGGDEAAVADVFQETMLAVAKSGRNVAEDSKLWPWLARIGHHQAALYWRKRYRDRRTCLDVNLLAGPPELDPALAFARTETVLAVRGLLADMNSDHAAILTAKYLDGLTSPQIQEVMGGTLESVRSRLARARRDFRQRYEKLTKGQNLPKTSAINDVSAPDGELP